MRVLNPDAPRPGWTLQIPAFFWDALRGGGAAPGVDRARFRPREELLALHDLIVSSATRRSLATLPRLLQSGEARAVVVRANGLSLTTCWPRPAR